MQRELPLRVTVVRPLPGVTFQLQCGRTDLVPPAQVSDTTISFDLRLRLAPERAGQPPNFLGPCAQGPPAGRFLYVNSGTRAGQADSCWDRRAKVPLSGITWALIATVLATPDTLLEAQIKGTARDGGPACATVPLLGDGWQMTQAV